MPNEAEAFSQLYAVIKKVRQECPWDKEQTPSTLRGDLIEEVYECIEAIDGGDSEHIKEELGDSMLLLAMIAYMHEQEGIFSIAQVFSSLQEKLIRRHPHVFGGSQTPQPAQEPSAQTSPDQEPPAQHPPAQALTPEEVLQQWATIKVNEEGRAPKDSLLDDVSRAIPPLDRANRLQKKAATVGFDWPDVSGVFDKLQEEIQETQDALALQQNGADNSSGDLQAGPPSEGLEEELGDLLFSAINLCRFLNVDPSVALHRANGKFAQRFRYVETRMREQEQAMSAEQLPLMEALWEEAKKLD